MKLTAQVITLNPNMKLRIDNDYDIEKNGKIIGVFGKSGCGKTSLFEYLFRHHKNEKIAYMKQDIILHPELTVYETLWFYTLLRCQNECANIEIVLEKMQMTTFLGCKVKDLSGGEKKRIMIAYHLLDDLSDFFLLDEPFSGIDPINTELIFSLMREKLTQRPCTILMSVHQIKPHIQEQLDELWTFVPSNNQIFQLEIRQQQYPDDEYFSDISLNDFPNQIIHKTQSTSSTFFHQWKYLFFRDRLLDRRNRFLVFLCWTTPLSIVLIQKLLIGSFIRFLYEWIHKYQFSDLFKTFLLYNILLFTVSISPMHMLNDHFHKRIIIQHEISQGLYRKNVYFINAILWDQLSLVLSSLCIVLLLTPSSTLFATTFFNIMMPMIFTNMLMWFCSSFTKSTYNMTLVLVTIYISIAFIGNMGFFLQNKSLQWIQYISMTNLQNNLFLEKLFILFPNNKTQLEFVSSKLNIHPRFSYYDWIFFSIGLWGLLPFLIIIPVFFNL